MITQNSVELNACDVTSIVIVIGNMDIDACVVFDIYLSFLPVSASFAYRTTAFIIELFSHIVELSISE